MREAIATVITIIMNVFGAHGHEAVQVAWCESRLHTDAQNGQYLGVFQLGSDERHKFARGRYRTARDQIRAAHRYFIYAGGWGPWSCRPA